MKDQKRRRIAFRTQLVLFAGLIVLSISLPVLYFEIQRPWQELDRLIDQGKIIVTDSQANFTSEDLTNMNNIALAINEAVKINDMDNDQYLVWTFNMLIMENKLLDKKTILQKLSENNVIVKEFNYARIEQTYQFWENTFQWSQEAIELFKKYKQTLINIRKTAQKAGFDFDDTYVMVDDGKKLMFLIDGGDEWWDSTYPGQEYDVIENNTPYFRDYLTKGPGFGTNPRHAPILPKFDTDEWGNWFSVWLSVKTDNLYNNFPIDFKADNVKKMMRQIFMATLTIIILIAVFIAPIINKLTKLISKPVNDLVAATNEIMNHNFDHQVPISGSSDFEHLINVFNEMIIGLKERVNLINTLEKILSPELAKEIAKKGLVLGGERVEASIMFTDFVGFSTITQNMDPQDVFEMLNEYWSGLIPVILEYGGFPDKFIGDAVVVLFGAPFPLENHAEAALSCAIKMQRKLKLINQKRKENNQPIFEMRLGINSGEVFAGVLGSDKKFEYTSIGETTNLAQRMESACQYGHILIAKGTFELVKDIFFDGVDFDQAHTEVQVKGYAQPVEGYNIFVSNKTITKNPKFNGNNEMYLYEEVSDKNLKYEKDLNEKEKAKFRKFVKI